MFKLARWTWRRVKDKKGISTSLVEAGATIAVGLTLAAAIVPIVMDKEQDAKIARAQSDTQAIATSIQAFSGDIQEYPSRERTTSRDSSLITIAAFRTGDATLTATSTNNGVTTTIDARDPSNFAAAYGSNGTIDNLNNHLVSDANYRTNGLNWKGPYSKTINQDPWGRNYVVLARAASFRQIGPGETATEADPTTTTLGTTATPKYYWVLSAGPDGRLDTTQTSDQLQGDDVGVVVAATQAPATSK